MGHDALDEGLERAGDRGFSSEAVPLQDLAEAIAHLLEAGAAGCRNPAPTVPVMRKARDMVGCGRNGEHRRRLTFI